MGTRLKIARATLRVMKETAIILMRGNSMRKFWSKNDKTPASNKLETGPARAMRAPSRLGLSRL